MDALAFMEALAFASRSLLIAWRFGKRGLARKARKDEKRQIYCLLMYTK